ncbi:MAG TPA: DinB family protein [Thermoanaerobaculia bacterium]|nr:DinB family protein [Thermoanaerobaculia bacterium]
MSAVEEAVRMWELYREGTIAELANIPEEHWEYRVGPGARTVRELALHIAGAASGFLDELLAEEPSFMRLRDPKVQAELTASFGVSPSRAELLERMKTRAADTAQRLRENAARLESGTMKAMQGEQSRVSGLWFAAAHEMYHRGQVASYARALGLVPAMTQRTSKPK